MAATFTSPAAAASLMEINFPTVDMSRNLAWKMGEWERERRMDAMDLTPDTGALAVWWVFNPPRDPYMLPVNNPAEAKEMIEHLAKAMLVTDAIEANVFGLVEWDGDEWTEWYSEDGESIDEFEVF